MAQESPYKEATIVRLVSDIYTTLIKLGYFEEEDNVWAPPGRHSLDLTGLDENARIDMRVISLMEHLPAMRTAGYGTPVVERMRTVNYLYNFDLIILDTTNALPTELQLLQGEQSDDPCLVLDIADIKTWPSLLLMSVRSSNVYTVDERGPWTLELRRQLIEDYGWPNDFRREDWKREGGDIAGKMLDASLAENAARVAAGARS
ncbi:hypothetical protein LTR85_009343 [Meristemomyces frigidus]|nr:hypothetical protein LTR85_009343 [Meristemomyces frigidus]